MTAEENATSEIVPITTLRFVAAIYVFLFHIHIRWPLAEPGTPAGQMLMQGAVGMSLFFVLSGFVLGFRFRSGVSSLAEYAFSRLTRIYPVYALAALVTVPWLIGNIQQSPGGDLRHAAQYVFLVVANLLMMQAWFPQLFSYWNNGGSWSISVEAFFYAVFPFAMRWLHRWSDLQIAAVGSIFYLLSSLPGVASILFPTEQSFTVFYAVPIFRLGEFLTGVCVGLLFGRGHRVPRSGTVFSVSSTILLLHLSFGPNFGWNFVAHNFLVVPLLVLIIGSAASLRQGPVRRALTLHWLRYLGQVSYSFYSFQALVVMSLIAWHAPLVRLIPVLTNAWLLTLCVGVVLIVISSVSYHLLETRLRDALHSSEKLSSLRRNLVW